MEFSHIPVLYDEVLSGLNIKPDGIYADGTLGGAGHSSGICEKLSAKGTLIGIDRDSDALNAAEKRLEKYECQKRLIKSSFSEIKLVLSELGITGLDGALLDLGVSSFQLDNPQRGFSYMHDAPLDMRMDQNATLTAENIINEYSEKDLAKIIRDYGEERWAARIAQFIAKERKERRITSTFELVDIIKAAMPSSARRDGPHPAKRTFQAIRIEVNNELGILRQAAEDFIDVLNSGGRLAIISFHSLEDRIVKETFARRLNPCTCPPEFPLCICGKKPDVKKVTGRPIEVGATELLENPRARSAKLRIVEKK